MNKNIVIFIFAGLLSFILDKMVDSGCKETFCTTLISIFHNYGSIYLVFGSLLFGYHLFHLLILIITVILWEKYTMCIFTLYYNKLCKIPKNRPFHDIFFQINKKLQIPYFKYILAFLVILYDIKNILNNYKIFILP